MIWSYIGDLDDPDFSWDNPSDATTRGGNLPRRVTPRDTFQSLGVDVSWVMRAIKEGRYDGKQLDWGAWGLKMTGGEIQVLLPSSIEILSALAPEKHYVLVVFEDA
jgi:hypothetical protein